MSLFLIVLQIHRLVDGIASVKVHSAGSGYTVGDIITIAGGSARIQVEEITNGGVNLDKLEGEPILGVTNPNDNETGLQNKSTDDGEPEFILTTTKNELKFEVVTKDGAADLEASLTKAEIMSQQR